MKLRLAAGVITSLAVAVSMLASADARSIEIAQAPITDSRAKPESKSDSSPPPDAKTLTTRADALRVSGDTDKAIADYDAALKADPFFVEALYGRATALRTKGERRRALRDLDAALKLKPDFELARTSRKELAQEIETLGARMPLKQSGAK